MTLLLKSIKVVIRLWDYILILYKLISSEEILVCALYRFTLLSWRRGE